MLYGPSETGKSARAIRDAIIVSQTDLVFYVIAEGSGGFEGRVLGASRALGIEPGDLWFWNEPVNLPGRGRDEKASEGN